MPPLFTEFLLYYWHRKVVCLPPHHRWWLILSWTLLYSSLNTNHPHQLHFSFLLTYFYTYSTVRTNLDRSTFSVVVTLCSDILYQKWNNDCELTFIFKGVHILIFVVKGTSGLEHPSSGYDSVTSLKSRPVKESVWGQYQYFIWHFDTSFNMSSLADIYIQKYKFHKQP